MRNVFDQYSQPENQLTHALACTLAEDRTLLRPFARWAGARSVPPMKALDITEQQVPGELSSGDENEGKGLPDASIWSDDGWLLMIESKIQSGFSSSQIKTHLRTAVRHGFESAHVLVISVDDVGSRLPEGATHKSWRDVYEWFRRHADGSEWASRFVRYVEIFESRMIAREYSIRGTLTMFHGLTFSDDDPYTYGEAKRLIGLLGDELRARKDLRKLGIDPSGEGRSAITGRTGDLVWDYIPLRVARGSSNFTDFPHLTMGIARHHANAAMTVPNGVKGGFRTKLKDLGFDGFVDVLLDVERQIRPVLRLSKVAKPMAYATQRHYRTQRSNPVIDGRMDFDLRTLTTGSRSRVKQQLEWAEAIYQLVINKRSNIQIGLEMRLPYNCSVVRSRRVLDLFAKSWIGMKPLMEIAIPK